MTEFLGRKDWMNIVAAISLVLVPLLVAPGKAPVAKPERVVVQAVEVAQDS